MRPIYERDGEGFVELRPIPGFPAYLASSDGRIWSLYRRSQQGYVVGDTPTEIHGTVGPRGYLASCMIDAHGKRRLVRVNRAVLLAFHGPPVDDAMVAAHWDNNKLNNKLSNLRWATQKENIHDKKRHGTFPVGSNHNHATLNEAQVLEIRRRYQAGETARQLAQEFGQKKTNIYCIVYRKTWKHI